MKYKFFHFNSCVLKALAIFLIVAGFLFIAPKAFASTYVGPTGITFSDFNSVGNAPNGFKDIQMTGGTSASIAGARNGVSFGAISYTGGSWVWDNFQGVNEDILDGDYCFYLNGFGPECTHGEFNISGGLLVPDDTSTRFVSTIPFDPFSVSADIVSGDATVEVSDTSDMYVGQNFSSPQFPTNSYVASITDSDTFESSNGALATGTFDLIFSNTLPVTETVGAQLYVNSDDWVDGMYLEISFENVRISETGGLPVSTLNDSGYLDGPLHFDIEETDTDQVLDLYEEITFDHEGVSRAWFRLVTPCTGVWNCIVDFFNPLDNLNIVIEKNVDFVVNALSTFDIWFQNDLITIGEQESVIGQIVENAINISQPYCKVFVDDIDTLFINPSFDFGNCLAYLFIPSADSLRVEFFKLRENVLSLFPFGYVTRFIEIIVTTEAVEPPALTYSFGTSSAEDLQTLTDGDPITFQIWDQFDELESIESDQGTNKNIWDLVMPYFNIVVALAVLFVILNDLLGIQIISDSTQDTHREDSYDSSGNETVKTTVTKKSDISFRYKGTSFGDSLQSDTSHTSVINRHKGSEYYKHGRSSRKVFKKKNKF